MSVIRWKTEPGGPGFTGGAWADAGPSYAFAAIQFKAGDGAGNAAFTAAAAPSQHPKLITVVKFNGADGSVPNGSLIADATGDLFGTTQEGGADGVGTVFEIVKTKSGYASKPIILASFTGHSGPASSNLAYPAASLFADAAGDLFGTTSGGGVNGDGAVFEIARTNGGYAANPITLASFTGDDGDNPIGSLISDAAGDLFGATIVGGADGDGAVFEIAKTRSGYAIAPTILVSFTGADGAFPSGGLVADAAGDLFGTTGNGGTDDDGTVFEISKNEHGYAGAPTTLTSFTGVDGEKPYGSLITDAAGNLFGATQTSAATDGTVFEIAKTGQGYAGAPVTLASFTGADGVDPTGSLIADAAGDLFGTTLIGGTSSDGTVFEIAKSAGGGYASAPTILVSFTGHDGANPNGGLIADAAGDLMGTTQVGGGANGAGTMFEIMHSGFVPPTVSDRSADADVFRSSRLRAAFVQAMASHGPVSGAACPTMVALRYETPTLLARPEIA